MRTTTLIARFAAALATLVVSSCSQLTAPPAVTTSGTPANVRAYFWPDSNATYVYRSDSDKHTITVAPGGMVTDDDSASGLRTMLTITGQAGSVGLTGLSSLDLFGLGSGVTVVTDTMATSTLQQIALRSIANSATGTLYAASDSVLYQYNASALTRVGPMPKQGLHLMDGRGRIYAVEFGGQAIYESVDGLTWSLITAPPGGIGAFYAADDPLASHFWVACGSKLFEYRDDAQINTFSGTSRIIALENLSSGGAFGEPLYAQDNGEVYRIRPGGASQLYGTAVPGQTIVAITRDFIATTAGLYELVSGASLNPTPVSALYPADEGTYVAFMDGSFYLLESDHTITQLRQSGLDPIAQISTPNRTGHHQGVSSVFGLVGSTLFQNDGVTMNWDTINRTWSTSKPLTQGMFTFLNPGSSSWQSAFLESASGGTAVALTDIATYVAGPNDVILDGGTSGSSTKYHDVIIIRYTAKLHGVTTDHTLTPEYLVYFQRGVGPIRIEKTIGGTTFVTRLSH